MDIELIKAGWGRCRFVSGGDGPQGGKSIKLIDRHVSNTRAPLRSTLFEN